MMTNKSIPIVDNYIMNTLKHTVDDWDSKRNAVVGFVLRIYDSTKFNALTSDLSGEDRTKLRKGCREQSNLLLDFKMAILKGFNSRNRSKIFTDFNVDSENVGVYDSLKRWGIYNEVGKRIKGIELQHPEVYRKECGEVINKLNNYINSFVYRKLRFIAKSNNLDLYDLSYAIRCEAIKCYYTEVPYKDSLYLVNTVKSKIHSVGQNLIKSYTTKKRSRLTQNEDGTFTGTIISTTGIDAGATEEYDLLERTVVDSDKNEYEELELKSLVSSLKSRYLSAGFEQSSKKYQALQILSMENHKAFLVWFNKNNETDFESVEDCFDYVNDSSEFLEIVRQFFNAGSKSWTSFIDELRKLCGGEV